MKGRGLLAAVLVGAIAGVLVLAATMLALQRASAGQSLLGGRNQTGVLLAVVLPDAAGNQAARIMVYYPPDGERPRVVDPLTPMVVPGTSADTLGDALTFGGGGAVAQAYAQLAGVGEPSWVVLDEEEWKRLDAGGLSVRLPRPVDVFDGTDLVSFPSGDVVVQPADAGTLLAALDELDPAARAAVLGQAAASVQRDLASARASEGLRSDLSASGLRKWLESLSARSDPETATP